MTTKFIKVREHKNGIGRTCLHCGRAATVTAVRKQENRFVLPVRYCEEHAIVRGVIAPREVAS